MSRAVRYRIVRKIAHGGMAEIYLALQVGAEGFEKQVVLKRILPVLAADPQFVRMLVDEAHIASTLNHSNLVQVLDLGKSGGEYFLVLEFVDGWSLEQVRRRAQKARVKFPLPLALSVTSALCRALAYVHTRKQDGRALGIVHRDVSPQNLLVSREGEVKLADFGIAKAIGKREKSATGVIKGKFAYMSPEQSIGAELDARSDLFSVGTLLYILTTGKKPFDGEQDLDVLMQVRKARFEKPSAIVKDFNPEVERFIVRALRADRSKRWQTAEQMADKLDAILVKLGQPGGPASFKRWLETLGAKDGARTPAESPEPAAPPTGTVELASRDLELEDVSPPRAPDETAAPATRAERRRSDRTIRNDEVPTSAAPPPGDLLRAEAVFAAPTRVVRAKRWLKRTAIKTAVVLAVLSGGAYFGRPYIPHWLVASFQLWWDGLPPPLGSGQPPAAADQPPSAP
jgi:serine/threonine protein kinase